MTSYPRIHSRLMNDEQQDFDRWPGILVAEHVALCIFDEHLEVHLVDPTPESGEYDLRFASNGIFHVGNDIAAILQDLQQLSMAEFASKYTHTEFHNNEQIPKEILRDEGAY